MQIKVNIDHQLPPATLKAVQANKRPTWFGPLLPWSKLEPIGKRIIKNAGESPAFYQTDDGLPAHAADGPSSWGRLIKCTGSLIAAKGLENKESPFAYEGTVAHKLAELAFNERSYPETWLGQVIEKPRDEEIEVVPVNQEMCDHVSDFLALCAAIPGEYRWAENIVDLSFWAKGCFGSCDFMILDTYTGKIHVIDLKYGKGVPVYAEQTPQPLGYALGAIWAIAKKFGLDWINEVVCHIYQPRISSYSTVTYTLQEVLSFGETMRAAIKQARMKTKAAYNPAPGTCQFCPAATDCKARHDYYRFVHEQTLTLIPDPDQSMYITDDQYAAALTDANGIVRYFNAIERAALSRHMSGREIPGYTAVAGRSNRSWVSADAAREAMLLAAQGDESAIYNKPKEAPLLSPSQAEKAFGAKAYRELIQIAVEKREGAPTLVADSDVGKRATVNPSTEYDALVTKQ